MDDLLLGVQKTIWPNIVFDKDADKPNMVKDSSMDFHLNVNKKFWNIVLMELSVAWLTINGHRIESFFDFD